LLVAVAAAVVALGVGLTPMLGGGSDETSSSRPVTPGRTGEEAPQDPAGREAADRLQQLARRDPHDPMAKGEADAPVVMVAYSEFQCPFCGKFARDTEPELVKRFVRDGTLRIEWRDFPYLGEESVTAAKAGRAAAAQDAFWKFHDALYENQLPVNSGNLTKDYLAGIARDVGLDVARLRRDIDAPQVADAVQRDFEEGQRIGVTGTPAFLVNGRPIMGAQPTAVFVDAIEQAAADGR